MELNNEACQSAIHAIERLHTLRHRITKQRTIPEEFYKEIMYLGCLYLACTGTRADLRRMVTDKVSLYSVEPNVECDCGEKVILVEGDTPWVARETFCPTHGYCTSCARCVGAATTETCRSCSSNPSSR